MSITNPLAIAFSDEQLRPLCEKARNLKAEIDALGVAWFNGVNALFPNDSTVLDDGRAAGGVSILTGANVNNAITQLLALQNVLNQSGVAQVIALPCVRPLRVSP